MFVAPPNQASLTIRRLADPLSIIFLGHGDLAPPWLQLKLTDSAIYNDIYEILEDISTSVPPPQVFGGGGTVPRPPLSPKSPPVPPV